VNQHDTRCPFCGRFVDANADGYYDTAERGADPEFTYVAAFCDESHAAKFHGRPVPANYWKPEARV
jgi:hypothetical protein